MGKGNVDKRKLLRTMENIATIGLLLVAVGMLGPLITYQNAGWTAIFKWIYVAGALCYAVPRIIAAFNSLKTDSLRIKRLRRMEMWAGVAFCLGAAFWIYNEQRYFGFFSLKVIHETITFTIVGAVIQMIASWLLSSAQKKQEKGKDGKGNAEKGK
jgi:hypothetical protein